jgi:hypothetical protein
MAFTDATDADAPIPAPEGCVTPEEHEREFTAMAIKCEELADSLTIDSENKNGSTVAKLIAESLKARRAASALAIEREKLVVLARLERNKRVMKSAGGNGRAPLRIIADPLGQRTPGGAQGH